jgi:hypothetical protein
MESFFQTNTHFLRYEGDQLFSVINLDKMKFEAKPYPTLNLNGKKEISENEYWNMAHALRTIQNEVNSKFFD